MDYNKEKKALIESIDEGILDIAKKGVDYVKQKLGHEEEIIPRDVFRKAFSEDSEALRSAINSYQLEQNLPNLKAILNVLSRHMTKDQLKTVIDKIKKNGIKEFYNAITSAQATYSRGVRRESKNDDIIKIANMLSEDINTNNGRRMLNENIASYAKAIENALDQAYHYGMSSPGSFGNAATIGGAKMIVDLLLAGEDNIELLANAAHEGWANIAKSFDDPIYRTKPEKKIARLKLANTPYDSLPEEEKEKDRVAARAALELFNRGKE